MDYYNYFRSYLFAVEFPITQGFSAGQQDIFKQATEDRLSSANELPYFEGDFWPNVLEESIKELEQEEEERKKEENTAACETPEVRPTQAASPRGAGGWGGGSWLCCSVDKQPFQHSLSDTFDLVAINI